MNRTDVDFTIVVMADAFPSGITVSRDILATAALLAGRAHSNTPRWRYVSLRGGLVPLQGDLSIHTQRLPSVNQTDRSTWVLLGISAYTPELIKARLQQADTQRFIKRLRQHVQQGGAVAASCSSVFLLSAAGLLNHRRATTTWWLAPYLRQVSPSCQVHEGQMVCVDGKLTTCGAAFAHIDLMLHLLREQFGAKLQEWVSSMLLIEPRGTQAHYVVPELFSSDDDFLTRITQRVESSLPRAISVASLARQLGISTRTLARRIQAKTGKSTAALIQRVRLRRAKFLLETSRLSIERIAESVGYKDAAALRRLMQRELGVKPTSLRPVRTRSSAGIRSRQLTHQTQQ